MRSGPLAEHINRPWVAWWVAVTALAAALAAQPTHALDSTRGPRSAPDPSQPTEVFRDEFHGATLAPHWTVERPNPAAFAVKDGALRVESREPGGIPEAGLTNLFRLEEPMPAGDWAVTAEFRLRLDTGAENFYLVLGEDEDHWFGAQIRSVPNKYTGHRLMLAAVEGRDGRIHSHERPLVVIECNVCDSEWSWPGFSRKLIDDRVVRLRIEKRGGGYRVSARLGSDPNAEWVEIEPMQSAIATRSLAFGLVQSRLPDVRQGAVPGGSSSASIDWIAIEVSRKPGVIAAERSAVAHSVPTR